MEMDEQRMSFAELPGALQAALFLLHSVVGFGIGRLYFYGVWKSAHLFQESALAALSWTGLRFALLVSALAFVAIFEGALPLLLTMIGFLAARHFVLRAAS
ncbi:MAG: hypothetical protein QM780_03675 [Hyphomicrobium sp.]|uniref:N-ATPase subunit AtpR n=1 Tax=Hyphomicrobium sp. TaxID=82 RepID=UPI0039E4F34F